MDLREIKVDDLVKSCTKGWGLVVEVTNIRFYVEFENDPKKDPYRYMFDGKFEDWQIKSDIVEWLPKKIQKVEKWITFFRDSPDKKIKVDVWAGDKTPVYYDSYEIALDDYSTAELHDSRVPKPVKVTWYE